MDIPILLSVCASPGVECRSEEGQVLLVMLSGVVRAPGCLFIQGFSYLNWTLVLNTHFTQFGRQTDLGSEPSPGTVHSWAVEKRLSSGVSVPSSVIRQRLVPFDPL